ncbi:hypothetical protein MIND_01290000 [Mycena indigotica]|uniref:Uncharacterized protein n=1 Tax=Mycena indigotica TaxID=2126181 RepID=A0A8H6S2F5_9AGAR|nr:uncharacterized protein MIND_01290000 [Mycena indigotica]KAF7291448.1 hypothetical protein MIND_01290000 [Mycena indigotica]
MPSDSFSSFVQELVTTHSCLPPDEPAWPSLIREASGGTSAISVLACSCVPIASSSVPSIPHWVSALSSDTRQMDLDKTGCPASQAAFRRGLGWTDVQRNGKAWAMTVDEEEYE